MSSIQQKYEQQIQIIIESEDNDATHEVTFNTIKNDVTISSPLNIKNYVHIHDTKVAPRAIAVLPAILHLRQKQVVPRRTLSSHVRFGPVEGIKKIITKVEAAKLMSESKEPVFLLNHNIETVVQIDVTDKDKSNWIGLLPLGDAQDVTTTKPMTANVWLYEDNNELYILSVQPIPARVPLRIGYSKKYCDDHNIYDRPVLDLETVNSVQWLCSECNRAFSSSALLKRHTELYHNVKSTTRKNSYRCKYCKRPFGRLFTLKRHMRSHCLKTPIKSIEDVQSTTSFNQVNNEAEIIPTLEDTRIPSDESFQNFTNSLDFSTNLFDTDRIVGLDLSVSSRVDSDLASYCLGLKDFELKEPQSIIQNNEPIQENTPVLDTCSYCYQVIAKQSKNKHLKQCPSRCECQCGRVFRHKKSLAMHIYTAHFDGQPLPVDDEHKNEKSYKCQECPFSFKRRGMLVNHLWRTHKIISTMPVEKKVKRYPCVACPRIYCSAHKRDKHVQVHHPGSEKISGRYIEGEVKSCQPASCTECPRQYATRAKLLQHIRGSHPHLAKTMYMQQKEQKIKSKLKRKY